MKQKSGPGKMPAEQVLKLGFAIRLRQKDAPVRQVTWTTLRKPEVATIVSIR
jgi:hypothetical protein